MVICAPKFNISVTVYLDPIITAMKENATLWENIWNEVSVP